MANLKKRIERCIRKNSKLLDLSLLELDDTVIIAALPKLAHIDSLELRQCDLQKVPEWLIELKKLQYLDISSNNLTNLPDWLSELKMLQSFDISSNNLKTLPNWLAELKGLHTLDISNNNLTNLPNRLSELKELWCLNLSHNKLKELPDWLGTLPNLDFIFSTNNNLKTIRLPSISSPSLKHFYIENNQLPFTMLKTALNGIDELRSYLKQQQTQGLAPLYEARLLIVGEPGAGKTTLMRKIINPLHTVPNEADRTTIGINVIEDLSFPWTKNKKQSFRYHIWDFGGQEIQYLTHQFFLTGRSLYILVGDNRKQDTDFDYWFHIVSLLGKSSPMLVVCNAHSNNPVSRFDEYYYRNLFPQLITEKIDVDFTKNDCRLEFLRKRIFETLSSLKHVGEELPAGWTKVRKTLRNFLTRSPPRNYLQLEEFKAICRKHQILTEDDQKILSGYLHDLGAVLHFQNDSTLTNTLFLNPKWVTEGVYRVLKDDGLDDAPRGRFTKYRLFNLWQQEGYSREECEMLLGLMGQTKLDICYPLRESHNEEYVVPIRLPQQRPHFDFDDRDCLEFQYHYEFQPRGLISRLLVYLHDILAKEQDEDLVWKQGFVVKRAGAGNRALIQDQRMLDGRKYLNIQVDGAKESRPELLAIIRYEIEKLHNSRIYKHVKVTIKIPCCGPVCSASSERTFFTLTDLEKSLNNGWFGVRCFECKKEIIIADMLGNVISNRQRDKDVVIERYGKELLKFFNHTDRGFNIDNDELRTKDYDNWDSKLKFMLTLAEKNRPIFNILAQSTATATSNSVTNVDIKIDMDIKNKAACHFTEAIDLLREDIEQAKVVNSEKIAWEIERGKKYLEAACLADNPETFKESPSAGRLKKFVEKLADGTSTLGKAVRAVDDGIDSVKKIAGYYNKIAQWCGLPVVPEILTK